MARQGASETGAPASPRLTGGWGLGRRRGIQGEDEGGPTSPLPQPGACPPSCEPWASAHYTERPHRRTIAPSGVFSCPHPPPSRPILPSCRSRPAPWRWRGRRVACPWRLHPGCMRRWLADWPTSWRPSVCPPGGGWTGRPTWGPGALWLIKPTLRLSAGWWSPTVSWPEPRRWVSQAAHWAASAPGWLAGLGTGLSPRPSGCQVRPTRGHRLGVAKASTCCGPT